MVSTGARQRTAAMMPISSMACPTVDAVAMPGVEFTLAPETKTARRRPCQHLAAKIRPEGSLFGEAHRDVQRGRRQQRRKLADLVERIQRLGIGAGDGR